MPSRRRASSVGARFRRGCRARRPSRGLSWNRGRSATRGCRRELTAQETALSEAPRARPSRPTEHQPFRRRRAFDLDPRPDRRRRQDERQLVAVRVRLPILRTADHGMDAVEDKFELPATRTPAKPKSRPGWPRSRPSQSGCRARSHGSEPRWPPRRRPWRHSPQRGRVALSASS